MGIIAVTLHNKYQNIQLPQTLGFFGGSRFVPIVTSVAAIFVGAAFYLVWPPIQNLLVMTGDLIASTGAVGTFFYGFLMRLCGAVGLHHMIYPMFWYTELGGRENIEDVDACITRLRVAVKDSAKVDKELLKKVGATAVLDVQGGIQAIYGAKAILYKNEINDILGVAD